MSNRWKSCACRAVLVLGLMVVWGSDRSVAQPVCTVVTEITDVPNAPQASLEPSTDGVGRFVGFASNDDLVPGGNPDLGTEIFVFDSVTDSLVQVTDLPSVLALSVWASVSDDGSQVAFASDGDVIPGGNTEANFEIYLYDTDSGVVTQVTAATVGSSTVPELNGDGTRVVFSSTADLVPGSNTDLNMEIFWYDVTSGTFHQVTNTVGGLFTGNDTPDISADGQWLVFESTLDPVPGGNGDGNGEVFLHEIATGITQQLTDTLGGSARRWPVINQDGTRVAFLSDRDLTGGNPTNTEAIFLYERPAGTIQQLSTGMELFLERPAISADGRRVTYTSLRLEDGVPLTELMLYDLPAQARMVGVAGLFPGITPGLDTDGDILVFENSADLTGTNPEFASLVYRARCPTFVDGFESGGTSAWDVTVP